MSSLLGIFRNPAIRAAFFGWLIAQLLKIPVGYYIDKKWEFRRAWSSGGMPSSHTAAAWASATTIGMFHGFDGPIFAVAALFAVIVMYDATGVRRAAGHHAKILNEFIELFKEDRELTHEKLKEWIGHTPLEVFFGFWLGVIVGSVTSYLTVYFNRI